MKKIFLIIFTAVAFVGCTLEEEVFSSSTPSTYYQSVIQCKTGLNGCYIPLRTLYGSADYFEVCEAASDLIYHGTWSYYDAQCYYDPTLPRFGATIWNQGYLGVMRCNAMYAAIERAPLTEAEKAPLLAECVILRAYYYYILTINFGDVPYYFEEVTDANNDKIALLPRMDRNVLRAKLMDQLSYWLERAEDEQGNPNEWTPDDAEYKERLAAYKKEQFELTGEEPVVACRQALPYNKTYDPVNEYRIGSMVGFVIAGKLAMWNKDFHRAVAFFKYVEDVYASVTTDGEYDPQYALANYPLKDVMFRNRYTAESIFELPGYAKDYGMRVTSGLASRCTPSRSSKDVEDTGSWEEEESDTTHVKLSDIYNGIRIPEMGTEMRTTSPYRPTKRFYQELMPYRVYNATDQKYIVDKRSARYDASKFLETPEAAEIEDGGGYLAWCYAGYGTDPDLPDYNELKLRYFSSPKSADGRPFLGDKFWCPGMVYTQDSNNKKIFRFAHVLLDLAEANMRVGNWDKANSYLNASRVRAGLWPLDIAKDEPLFMSELQDESARELLGEFTRRHNLVRWGIFVENVLKYTDSSHLKTYLTENPGREYYPIPEQQVLLSNGNLTNDNY